MTVAETLLMPPVLQNHAPALPGCLLAVPVPASHFVKATDYPKSQSAAASQQDPHTPDQLIN